MYIQQPPELGLDWSYDINLNRPFTIVFDSNELYVQITCGKFQHVQNVM